MKNFVFLICFCLISSPVFAQNESNYIFSGKNQQQIQNANQDDSDDTREKAEQVWDETVNNYVTDHYGSDESPAFSNRENINPHEDQYDSGGADGVY